MIGPVWKITKQYQTSPNRYDVTIRAQFGYPPVDFGIAGSNLTWLLVETVGLAIFRADHVTNQRPLRSPFAGEPLMVVHTSPIGCFVSLFPTKNSNNYVLCTDVVTICNNW